MTKLLLSALLILGCCVFVQGQKIKVQGIANLGGKVIVTSGTSSTTKAIQSYPNCTVTVYATGTTNLISLWSDYAGTITKSNPFTAGSDASFSFYATVAQRIDIRFSGTGITTPFTLSDVQVVGATSTPSGAAGAELFCDDCKNSVDNAVVTGAVCVNGGNGAKAVRANGHWACY